MVAILITHIRGLTTPRIATPEAPSLPANKAPHSPVGSGAARLPGIQTFTGSSFGTVSACGVWCFVDLEPLNAARGCRGLPGLQVLSF